MGSSLDVDPVAPAGGDETLDRQYERVRIVHERRGTAVWMARHRRLGCWRALKVFDADESDSPRLDRVRRGAGVMSRVRHSCVAEVHDLVDAAPGRVAVALEWVDGVTIRSRLSAFGAMSPTRAVPVVIDLLRGLGAIHEEGILHRGVSAKNILLARSAAGGVTAKLVDFDLAMEPPAGDRAEAEGAAAGGSAGDERPGPAETEWLIGSPAYMPPEVSMGRIPDSRSDLYSAGVVLYEVLAGRLPFDADQAYATLLAHAKEEPPALPSGTPRRLEELVGWMLEKAPDSRPQTAAEAIAALSECGLERPAPGPRRTAGDGETAPVSLVPLSGGPPVAVRGSLVLGRGPGSDLRPVPPEDEFVSRRHARVRVEDDECWLDDLGSTNGTFVDGLLVERARLRPGSTLRLGVTGPAYRVESGREA